MANFERGVYEPSDDMRVFDGAEEDEDVEGSRLPLLIVLALLVLAMFAGVVWLAYTQGVARGRGETPVLAAAGGPERVAPPDGGGNTVPYQGFKIYEQPAPSDDGADNTSAPKAAPAKSMLPPPSAKATVQAAPAPKAAAPSVPAPKAVAQSMPAPKPEAKPAPVAPVAAKPAAPANPPAPAKSVAGLIQQANSTPSAKPSMAAASAAKPAAPVEAKAAASGGYVLQIGAYKSQADAEGAWKAYKARHAALVSGYSDDVRQVDLGEKGTWYRLRIDGFSDKQVATALCDRLKADGGACILGR